MKYFLPIICLLFAYYVPMTCKSQSVILLASRSGSNCGSTSFREKERRINCEVLPLLWYGIK